MRVILGLRRRQSARCAWGIFGVLLGSLVLAGCSGLSTQTVKPTAAYYAEQQIPEDLLLDVDIAVFDPGLEKDKKSRRRTARTLTFARPKPVTFRCTLSTRCSSLGSGVRFESPRHGPKAPRLS